LVLIALGVAAYVVHWLVKHHRKKEALPPPETSGAERSVCSTPS